MIFFNKSLISAVALLCLCSCASISTLQTAKTTDKGSFDHTFGFGNVKADVSAVSGVEIDSGNSSEESISFPMIEYMGRYGISNSFDLGIRTTGLAHGIDGKWNFLDSGSLLMSLGFGVNYLGYTISNGTTEFKVRAIDLVPSLFVDFVVNEKFRFYLVPKLVNRKVTVTDSSDESIDYMGGSIGMKWGNTSGIFLEYTVLKGNYTPNGSSVDVDVDLSQVAAGFFF